MSIELKDRLQDQAINGLDELRGNPELAAATAMNSNAGRIPEIPRFLPEGISSGCAVSRWHVRDIHNSENIAEHTWHVFHIYRCLFGFPAESEMKVWFDSIMYHDSGEVVTGDIPSPSKYAVKGITDVIEESEEEARKRIMPDALCNRLDEPDMWRAKICDVLSARNFTIREMLMGNQLIRGPYESTVKTARKIVMNIENHDVIHTDQDRIDVETAKREIEFPFSVMK